MHLLIWYIELYYIFYTINSRTQESCPLQHNINKIYESFRKTALIQRSCDTNLEFNSITAIHLQMREEMRGSFPKTLEYNQDNIISNYFFLDLFWRGVIFSCALHFHCTGFLKSAINSCWNVKKGKHSIFI